jgi:hypothetical protein
LNTTTGPNAHVYGYGYDLVDNWPTANETGVVTTWLYDLKAKKSFCDVMPGLGRNVWAKTFKVMHAQGKVGWPLRRPCCVGITQNVMGFSKCDILTAP